MPVLGPDFVSRIIQPILAPVVMVTSCAILLGGLLSRYSIINDRIRSLNRERLDLLRAGTDPSGLNHERMTEIDVQAPELLHRLRIGHRAIGAVYSAILIFILDMFIIALVAFTGQTWTIVLALGVFFAGLISVCIGVASVAYELQMAMTSIAYEVEKVRSLKPPTNQNL
jgi:hypothetical protein